jgi:hypothetical protein
MMNTFVALLATFALAGAGCSKDKKEDGKGGESGKEGSAKPAEGKGGSASSGSGSEVSRTGFSVFPKDYDVVGGISLAAVRKGAAWGLLKAQIEKEAAKNKDYKEFVDTCGIDPIGDIDSIIMGGNTQASDEDFAMVVQGIEKGKAKSCIEAMAKKEGKEVKIEEEDGGKFWKVTTEKKTGYAGWLDDKTVVFGAKSEGSKDWIAARVEAKDGLDKNPEILGLLKSADSSNQVWFAMKSNKDMAMPMGMALGGMPAGLYGALNFSKALSVKLGARMPDAKAAEASAKHATTMISQGKGSAPPALHKFIDKVAISNADNDVKVSLELTEAELNEIEGILKKLTGGMMQ